MGFFYSRHNAQTHRPTCTHILQKMYTQFSEFSEFSIFIYVFAYSVCLSHHSFSIEIVVVFCFFIYFRKNAVSPPQNCRIAYTTHIFKLNMCTHQTAHTNGGMYMNGIRRGMQEAGLAKMEKLKTSREKCGILSGQQLLFVSDTLETKKSTTKYNRQAQKRGVVCCVSFLFFFVYMYQLALMRRNIFLHDLQWTVDKCKRCFFSAPCTLCGKKLNNFAVTLCIMCMRCVYIEHAL